MCESLVTKHEPLSNGSAAIGAIGKIFFQCFATGFTSHPYSAKGCFKWFLLFSCHSSAVLTGNKRRTFFNGKDRNEEKAQVVINALKVGTHVTAGRTEPWRIINNFCFWLYAADEEKHLFVARSS
jgi:hypothetical protein